MRKNPGFRHRITILAVIDQFTPCWHVDVMPAASPGSSSKCMHTTDLSRPPGVIPLVPGYMVSQTVNAIETGKYDPSLPLAFKFARVFGLRIEDIFSEEGDTPRAETT